MADRENLDVPYAADHADRRLIDVFEPAGPPNGAGILFIHGGGFSAGDKAQWREVCRHFAARGYVCASAEYRLAPRWKFPAQVEDVRLAMAWFRARAGQYGFSPDRIAAAGSSAGGYLALMLATIGPDDELGRTAELGAAETVPQAVVAYCPVITLHEARRGEARFVYPDFMPVREAEDPQLYRTASIEDRITGAEPPMLLLHGRSDEVIPFSESFEFVRQVGAAGGTAELVDLADVGHGFGYGVRTDAQRRAVAEIEQFLGERL